MLEQLNVSVNKKPTLRKDFLQVCCCRLVRDEEIVQWRSKHIHILTHLYKLF